MSTIYIKPTSPKIPVKDPETRRPLADEGEHKPKSPFWMRRLRDGDVVEATPPKAAKAAASTNTQTGGNAA
jgi:hypothetical protein